MKLSTSRCDTLTKLMFSLYLASQENVIQRLYNHDSTMECNIVLTLQEWSFLLFNKCKDNSRFEGQKIGI